MKNILFILLFFLSIACASNKSSQTIDCPPVFFASEHRAYIVSNKKEEINIENLAVKVEINNYQFNNTCIQNNNIYTFPVDILFIAYPFKITSDLFDLPVYVALLDSSGELIEIQYFSLPGNIKTDKESKEYIETEITKSINVISSSSKKISSLLIGFMLDKKKKDFLN